MTKKQLKKEVEFYKELAEENAEGIVYAANKITEMYESQLDVQDKEIRRLHVIINYLEEKCLKVYE